MTEAPFPRDDDLEAAAAVKKRGCHDKWCILYFLLVVTGMVGMAYWALAMEGADIARLLHPADFSGRTCGKGAGVEDKPFLYVCGLASEGYQDGFPKKLDFWSKTCISECPSNNRSDVECIGRPYVLPRAKDCTTDDCIDQANQVQVRRSVTWEVAQAITYQKTYATEPFRGTICAPSWAAPNDLRWQVINGPRSPISSIGEAVGSLETAWPILLAVFVIATILSMVFLRLMSFYAGLVLFVSLGLGALLLFLAGLWFSIGVFFDPYDQEGWYQLWNPIIRSVYGEWARMLTLFAGLLLVAVGLLLFRAWMHSQERLDEPIGILHASFEFMFQGTSSLPFMVLVPFGSSVMTLAALGLFCWSFMLVLSAGPIDSKGIYINGDHYPSLYKTLQKPLSGIWWDLAVVGFVLGLIWITELMLAVGQFVVSFCVCRWFFVEIGEEKEEAKPEKKVESTSKASASSHSHGHRVDNLQIKGGPASGTYSGVVETDEKGTKRLVVDIFDKGPDDKPMKPIAYENKPHECGWICEAYLTALGPCIGTLLRFCWPVCLTRPLRVMSEVIMFLTTPAATKTERKALTDDDEDDRSVWGLLATAGDLFAKAVTHEFGGYSKDAFVDLVLRDVNFASASRDVHDFIQKSGGVVAFLHGMTRFYEIISTCFIMFISSFLGFVAMNHWPIFSHPDSSWYVADPSSMQIVSLVISGIVAFSWISVCNNTCDSLLYAFCWTRKQLTNDPKCKTLGPLSEKRCKEMDRKRYCPGSLLDLLKNELDEAPRETFKAATKSQNTRFSHAHRKLVGQVQNFVSHGPNGPREEREYLLRSQKPPGMTTRGP